MIVKTYSYRYAEEILQHPKYVNVYNELIEICKNCPIPVYEKKSTKQGDKNVIQQMMNTYFTMVFTSKGWEAEPLATPKDSEDALRSDFRKTFKGKNNANEKITLQIEVEFGNVASAYRNYFKFQLSYAYGLTDVCVLILPSQHLSTRIDSGVANYEKALREIPSAKLSITVPVLIIGLLDKDEEGNDVETWDIKKAGVELAVAQNKNKGVSDKHLKIMKEYVEKNYSK